MVTITSSDESQLAGELSAGAGWIGGTDEEEEGVCGNGPQVLKKEQFFGMEI